MRSFKSASLLASLLVGACSAFVVPGNPLCFPVTFRVAASAENKVITNPPDPNNETAIVQWSIARLLGGGIPPGGPVRTVSGNFTVSGTFCPSLSLRPRKEDVLQVLVSGATYGQEIWRGYGVKENDFVAYATKAGYHVLTLDRLGHGVDKQRPDPLGDVQTALQAEIIHQVIKCIRDSVGSVRKLSSILVPGITFKRDFKIAYVCHSLGCSLGVALARLHPADADAYVMSGLGIGASIQSIQSFVVGSARRLHPGRFPQTLPLGYLTFGTEAERRTAFYYPGHYNPVIPPRDFATQDTWTPGEATTSSLPAVGYTGKVVFVNGDKDHFSCTAGDCDTINQQTAALFFPDATTRGSIVVTNSGHDWSLHHSAPTAFGQIQQFLDSALRT
ncbi:hypothetical protein RB595_002957 [Gaeumannomyces hyphopodioides]